MLWEGVCVAIGKNQDHVAVQRSWREAGCKKLTLRGIRSFQNIFQE